MTVTYNPQATDLIPWNWFNPSMMKKQMCFSVFTLILWFAWWENDNGDGAKWTKHWIPYEFWGAGYCNTAGDGNNDGKLDVIVTSEEFNGYPGEQLHVYELSEFRDTGEMTGSILDGGTDPLWEIMTWDATVPIGASLDIEVRASDDESDLEPHITVPAAGTGLDDLIDPTVSPILRALSVTKGESSLPPNITEGFLSR